MFRNQLSLSHIMNPKKNYLRQKKYTKKQPENIEKNSSTHVTNVSNKTQLNILILNAQ